ncbi:hypothetical protein [Paenibacillus elgii]|uniref:hypothetical protein n=1 Tax=Paenibacillus elgii TaxID=189691 RepID=UPI000248E089|nr:hypothetical protein [Paenibacillus elgii]
MVQLSYETFFILTGWIVAVLGILIHWFRNTLREEIRRVRHEGLVQLEEAQKQFDQQFAETAKRIDANRQRMEDRRKERAAALKG